ncbi:murein biosynthesis integral membrane protein MurJ [Candidatus Dependentiae bacterium]|nr:murein biosynthesis integral membrane protein MurJ [Candidatus Dependentiae bacterium]
MSQQLSKRSIVRKTIQVAILTFFSRILGVVREFLMVRYFGVGAVSDAFIAAFRIPNFFRHVFAEGALSASFVPVIVKTVKENNKHEASGLMTVSFLFFEGIILLMYAFVLFKADWVIGLVAPGFSAEQIGYAIPFVQILFSFLLFISSCALLGGALHSVNHFFIPALGTPLWNVIFIGTLLLCLGYQLPATYLCGGIIFGAFVQFLLHLFMYFKQGFTFGVIDPAAKAAFKTVLTKFLPCLFGVSIFELNMFISGSIASYLPKGSVSLLYYGSRFMNIPLGMFAVALSSVLLPHFSRLVLYAPRRLHFYLLEVTKLVTWVIIPATIFLIITAEPLFEFLLNGKATPEQIHQGGMILILYLVGLLFLCLNKVLLSMFYALKDTWSATKAAALCASINILCDLVGMYYWGADGIAAANSISAIAMSITLFSLLKVKHHVDFHLKPYARFLMRYVTQILVCALGAYVLAYLACKMLPIAAQGMFAAGIGYWVYTIAVAASASGLLFATRRFFGVNVYFLKR